MSIVARSSFESALSSHAYRFFSHPQTGYRLIKAADCLFDAASEIAQAAQTREEVVRGLAAGRVVLRVMQHLQSVSYIIFHLLPRLFYALKLQGQLLLSFKTGQDVQLHSAPSYNSVAHGNTEKILCLGFLSARTAKTGFSLFTTTVCQPLLYLQTYSSVSLSEPLDSIASSYQTLTLAKHCAGFVALGCELAYEQKAFKRASQAEDCEIYSKRMAYLTTGIIENGLHIISDSAKMLQTTVPPWLRLPLSFATVTLGLYRTWQLTDVDSII